MNIPTWAFVTYGVVLGLVLVLAEASSSTRRRRPPIRHASRLWASGAGPGAPTRIPPLRSLAPAPPTMPIAFPDDTIPLAVTGPDEMVRPYARGIPIPTPANGHPVLCPVCGGGRLAGRVLFRPRPDCAWCAPTTDTVL